MLCQGYDQNGLPSHMPMESAFGPRCGAGSPEGALLEAPATWWKDVREPTDVFAL